MNVSHGQQRQHTLTCFRRPGVPTTAWGVLLFSCSICVLMGSPPKKFPTRTFGMYVLKRSNSWQICIKHR